MRKTTLPLTVDAATADAGIVTDVVTSATGEIAVLPVAELGCVLVPSLVVVPMLLLTATEPLAGAVKLTPKLTDVPLAIDAGIPVKVTPPVLAS